MEALRCQVDSNKAQVDNNQGASQSSTESTAQKSSHAYNISLKYKINEAEESQIDYTQMTINELNELEKIINEQLKNITDKFTIIINQLKKKYDGISKTINAAELAMVTIQDYIFSKKLDMFAKSTDKNKIAQIQKQRADSDKKVKDLTFKINSEANSITTNVPKIDKEYNYTNTENEVVKVKIISLDDTKKEATVNSGDENYLVKYENLIKIDGIDYN